MMVKWFVYLNGKQIDAVFYESNCQADYVYESLVNHDGYNPNIKVRKEVKL